MKKERIALIILAANIIVLVAGVGLFVSATNTRKSTLDLLATAESYNRLYIDQSGLVAESAPSVLRIRALDDGIPRYGEGTGFVWNDDYMLTNAHVIEFGFANNIEIYLPYRTEPVLAEIVGIAPCEDIALLKFLDPIDSIDSLVVTEDNPRIGDPVWVIGYAHNTFINADYAAINEGRITRTNISIASYPNLLQHEAVVNRGDSGSPLLNVEGHVVGMNTFAYDQGQEVSFAIESGHLISIASMLVVKENASTGFVYEQSLDDQLVKDMIHVLDRHCWTFDVRAGHQIQINVNSVDPNPFQPKLYLFGPTNLLFESQNIDKNSNDAQIVFEPQINGRYTLMIERDQQQPGTYSLEIIEDS